jgi:hypothetical protein
MRPRGAAVEAAESRHAKTAKHVIEQPVHVAMKRKERVGCSLAIALGADGCGKPVLLPAPGDQITERHDGYLLVWLELGHDLPATAPTGTVPASRL